MRAGGVADAEGKDAVGRAVLARDGGEVADDGIGDAVENHLERDQRTVGAQCAGDDPRDMANVFKTIQQESGPGAPATSLSPVP